MSALIHFVIALQSGVDPGFPVWGDADPRGGGANIWFCQIFQKLHEIEKILGRRGACAECAPPPKSATGNVNDHTYKIQNIQNALNQAHPIVMQSIGGLGRVHKGRVSAQFLPFHALLGKFDQI